jgi:hypothetical protein
LHLVHQRRLEGRLGAPLSRSVSGIIGDTLAAFILTALEAAAERKRA